ncbi:MAG: alpha/beta fold hydrolase [Verrucomicrobia bacterium]|nr:alpha/beta fold hydrolase [Verrucomicrobiota bacterium]
MNLRGLFLIVALALAQVAGAASRFTGPWNVAALQATPKAEWGGRTNLLQQVYYEGEPFNGKPTRIFAYYARPAEGNGPFPAMVLVHGGGGKAFSAWAEHWARRGYCAIAMDLSGNGPAGRLTDGGPDQGDGSKFREFTDADAKEMWTYHAVAAVLRGHSLLAALPEVDKGRIGVTGISWGGYLTCIVAGIDDRLKVAVPVYGCGFLHENSVWLEPRFAMMTAELRDRWVSYFDPSKYLPGVACPILFLNGSNDFAYPMDSYKKCYQLVAERLRKVSVKIKLPHGHIWTFGEVDQFVDSHLRAGPPLASLTGMKLAGDSVTTQVTASVAVTKAEFHFTTDSGPWQKRNWQTLPAQLADGLVTAKLPVQRPLVCYLSVTDSRGIAVSTQHEELSVTK